VKRLTELKTWQFLKIENFTDDPNTAENKLGGCKMFTVEIISVTHIPYCYYIGSYFPRCWHLSPVKEGVHWQVLSFRHWPPFSHGGLHSSDVTFRPK
jgi:hypothetical protein